MTGARGRLLVLAFGLAAAAAPLAAGARAQSWAEAGGSLFPGGADAAEPQGLESGVRHVAGTLAGRVPEPVQPFAAAVAEAAARYGLDPKLLHALVLVESAYRADAVSPAGAAGLAQLMPATAAELGVADRLDPLQSLDGGAAYLARQVIRFGDIRLALAAYNAGPARVARLGRVPKIKETEDYVTKVVDCYLALAAGRSVRVSSACGAGE